VLASPLLLYADPAVLREKSQVADFVSFYLEHIRNFDEVLSYFISSTLVLDEAKVALQEAITEVPTDERVAETDSAAEEQDEQAFEDIFTVPSPLIPLAPISPTIGLTPTAEIDQTSLADLEGSMEIVGNASVLSPTETIANGFRGLGFSGTISLTAVSSNQAFEFFCESDQAEIASVSEVMQDDVVTACSDAGRRPLALRVGTDVIAIVTNPNNDFVSTVTLEQLETLFTARRWSDVDPEWPDEPIQRFIPPLDSNVVDLFVEQALNDEIDQLLLVPNLITVDDRGRQAQGITTNPYALGFMEYPAYQRNAGLLNLVAIADIVPEDITIEDGSYPLLRPLILYADANMLDEQSQVAAFLNFYLTNAHVAMEPLNYVPASSQILDEARTTLRQAVNPPPP
jgi:phosphate transport system substrate-binding protein